MAVGVVIAREGIPELFKVKAPPMTGRWTFWAEHIATGTPLGPVQVADFKFSQRLNDFGKATATVIVEQIGVTRFELIHLWAWKIWALYDGVPMWCGVPTGIEDTGVATVSYTMLEIDGYLTKRVLDDPFAVTNTEQTEIARRLAAPVADVGVRIVTDPGPGFPRDRTYEYLEGRHRAELLTNLAQVIGGPEFRLEYSVDVLAHLSATLRIAYPRVGTFESGLGASVPGTSLNISARWDSDRLRTRTFAVGDVAEGQPAETPKPVVMVDRPDPDLPRLDEVDDWPSVVLMSSLNDRANTNATIYGTPTLSFETETFESDPPLDTYAVGDDVTVSITDTLLPDGLIATGRLVGREVDTATGKVKWETAMVLPPPRPRRTLSGVLGDLNRDRILMWRRRLRPAIVYEPEEDT